MSASKPLKNYIRSARKRAGLTQDELVFLLGGRGGKLVSRYERFEREPMLPMALALQVALGQPVHELFTRTFQEAREIANNRARVMQMQLRRKASSPLIELKRQTVLRILESTTTPASSTSP